MDCEDDRDAEFVLSTRCKCPLALGRFPFPCYIFHNAISISS